MVLVVIDEGTKVLVLGLVQVFCLTNTLGVKRRGKVSFYSHNFAQVLPEFAGPFRVPIQYDFVW